MFLGQSHHGERPQAPSSEDCRLFGAACLQGGPPEGLEPQALRKRSPGSLTVTRGAAAWLTGPPRARHHVLRLSTRTEAGNAPCPAYKGGVGDRPCASQGQRPWDYQGQEDRVGPVAPPCGVTLALIAVSHALMILAARGEHWGFHTPRGLAGPCTGEGWATRSERRGLTRSR